MTQETGPENLSEVLGRMFVSRGWGRKTERIRLETAWEEVIQANYRAETRLGSFRRGVLEVEVRNSVLMQELAQFQKRQLLTELRKRLTGLTITDLKFRAAAW
jgi:predicted nucleic acid-binding Zn ribbon protein